VNELDEAISAWVGAGVPCVVIAAAASERHTDESKQQLNTTTNPLVTPAADDGRVLEKLLCVSDGKVTSNRKDPSKTSGVNHLSHHNGSCKDISTTGCHDEGQEEAEVRVNQQWRDTHRLARSKTFIHPFKLLSIKYKRSLEFNRPASRKAKLLVHTSLNIGGARYAPDFSRTVPRRATADCCSSHFFYR
jgi:hypothetical protein